MGDTLRYILSDKELQPEIERVCREMRVMRAEQTIEAMVAQEGAQFDVLPLAGE